LKRTWHGYGFHLIFDSEGKRRTLIAKRQAAVRHEHEQKLLAAEREENKKFHGTPVTPETFKSWREGFRKEIDELRAKQQERG